MLYKSDQQQRRRHRQHHLQFLLFTRGPRSSTAFCRFGGTGVDDQPSVVRENVAFSIVKYCVASTICRWHFVVRENIASSIVKYYVASTICCSRLPFDVLSVRPTVAVCILLRRPFVVCRFVVRHSSLSTGPVVSAQCSGGCMFSVMGSLYRQQQSNCPNIFFFSRLQS